MRSIAALVASVGLLLATAGCDPVTDRVFFRQGIGTELNSGDIAASTSAQNEYVKYICEQAGLELAPDGGCGSSSPKSWQLFVQAGMNDIDQRCDAYLLWLDYVRRAKDPTLRILADAESTTTIIMDRAGVSSAPIAIAAAAFGFARNTFTNVSSRLILEVNHSAVQSVVLSFQKQFREELLGSADVKSSVVIASKPAAIYALRSYLRLCMPVTIEAEINNTVVTFARGGPQALYDQEPLVSGRSVGVHASSAVISDVKKSLPPIQPNQPPNPGGHTAAEKSMRPDEVAKIHLALCMSVGGSDLGPDGSPTRLAIRDYLMGIQYGGVSEATKTIDVDDRIRTKLTQATKDVTDCSNPAFGFANAYEVGRFGIPKAERSNRIMTFQKKLKKFIETSDAGFPPPDVKESFDAKTRAAIAEFRKKATPPLPKDAPFDQQIDRALFIKVNAIRL